MKSLIDLHTHSVLSKHAYSSFTENIEYASQIGLKYYGISEHQPDIYGVGAHPFAFGNCRRVTPKIYNKTHVLVGIELNILDGGFDYAGIKMERLDFAIASMHEYAYPKSHTYIQNTENYLMAVNNPYVKIIGHMDDPGYACDYEKVVKEAKKKEVLIELNNASINPHGPRPGASEIDKEILSYCKKYNVPILMGTDAHIKYDIGNFDYNEAFLKEIKFPNELIVNYHDELIHHYFNIND